MTPLASMLAPAGAASSSYFKDRGCRPRITALLIVSKDIRFAETWEPQATGATLPLDKDRERFVRSKLAPVVRYPLPQQDWWKGHEPHSASNGMHVSRDNAHAHVRSKAKSKACLRP